MSTSNAQHNGCFLIVALMGLILLPGCATAPNPAQHGIPNLGIVSTGIYRGGQPNDEGWRWLANQGVTRSIKLNEEKYDPEDGAIAVGIKVSRFPINVWQQTFTSPDMDKLNSAVSLMDCGQPVYVHCSHGMDRTGLVVYLYRIKHGWSKSAAQDEAFSYGFHADLNGLWRVMAGPQRLHSPKDNP